MCKNVHVGQIIDMGMEVRGDGAALAPNPIDAMLIMDRSGSMGTAMDGYTRIYWAKSAGATFVGKMDNTRDKVGLTSFSNGVTVDYGLSDQFTDVITEINGMSASGYTATRDSLKQAIGQFPPYDPADKTVRAIILLTDGEFNYYADPLARGNATSSYAFTSTRSDRHYFFSDLPAPLGDPGATGGANKFTNQNMSEYALSKHIRIYTISVSRDLNSGMDTWKVLVNLANSTEGKHFHANTGAELDDYYTQIAGELQEKAAGDAQIKLDFSGAKNGVDGSPLNIKDYMEYVYDVPTSTHVKMVNKTQTIYDYTQDDRTNWSRTPPTLAPLLDLKAGEMNLNDVWSLNFKVNLTKAGNIRLFGPDDPNSKVCFIDVKTNKETCSIIEEINCPVKEDITGTFNDEKVTVDITSAGNLAADPKTLTVNWQTTYVGDGTVEQTLSYKNVDITNPVQHYTTVNTVSDGAIDPASPKPHQFTIDTSTWPPGRYSIRVIGSSGKASNSDEAFWVKTESSAQVYLKLE